MDSVASLAAHETISANLRLILRGLMATLGMWLVQPALAVALYRRISPIAGRIERMLARFRAGRLWRATQRDAAMRRQAHRKPAAALPRRFGWLVLAGGHQAASVGSQLQAVLNSPEMVELLAASAQAGRILRPLCRALAVELPKAELLGMASPARQAETERGVTRPRKTRPRAAPEPFRILLPRGVLSAARRAGFGKVR